MAKTVKSRTLDSFKASNNLTTLKVKRSSKDNLYAVTEENELVAWVAANLDPAKPVLVHQMQDEETGETWEFMANGELREAEFTL